jgi:hopene-associated glycosyltransferase HpnB
VQPDGDYHSALLLLPTFVLLIWLYLFFLHGGFWQVHRFKLPSQLSREDRIVAVVVPARHEADVIGSAVTSLLKQSFAGQLHIFVVDDNSCDLTASAAREAAEALGARTLLTIIQGSQPPDGWKGKVWAMQQGWIAAREMRPDYLLLTDADIWHESKSLARLISQAERGPYDLVSLMVKLRCDTLAEKFLIPAFVYFFFLLYPPQPVSDSRRRVAGAAGGCVLLRPEALQQAGGFEAIRREIIDDCSLAARVKETGGKLWLGVTEETYSMRGYGGFKPIRDMIARTAFNQLRHSTLLLGACICAMLLTFVAPLALVWSRSKPVGWIAVAASAMMFATYVPVLRLYRVKILSAVTLPFAAFFYLYATVCSAMNYWLGRGGEWKGRAQDRPG